MADFLRAFGDILIKEGGYVDDESDPGGETRYGISKRSYPDVDIKELSLDDAYTIYLRDYWRPMMLDRVGRQDVAEEIFEQSVHMGLAAAGEILQSVLVRLGADIKVDGIVGDNTLAAVNGYRYTETLLKMLNVEQANYYLRLVDRKPKMAKYIRGWLKRVSVK